MSKTYELIYFGVQGRAEPIRLLFALAGQPFTDHRVTDWPTLKPQTPLGQMPVLIERDERGERHERHVPQSQAILRHLARTFGLTGTTADEMLATDIFAETSLDAGSGLSALLYGAGRGNAAAFEKHFNDVWPMHGKRLATLLAQSKGPFIAGEKATYGDLVAFQVLHAHRALSPSSLDAFPTLLALHDRIAALPALKAYIEERPAHEGVNARPAA